MYCLRIFPDHHYLDALAFTRLLASGTRVIVCPLNLQQPPSKCGVDVSTVSAWLCLRCLCAKAPLSRTQIFLTYENGNVCRVHYLMSHVLFLVCLLISIHVACLLACSSGSDNVWLSVATPKNDPSMVNGIRLLPFGISSSFLELHAMYHSRWVSCPRAKGDSGETPDRSHPGQRAAAE